MDGYEEQIKRFMENKAVSAEAEIHGGMSIKTAANKLGYKDVRALTAAIRAHGRQPPLTATERENLRAQIAHRAPSRGEQTRVGKLLGVSWQTIYDWSTGRTAPLPCMINNIARAFGCKRDDLFLPVPDTIPRGATKHTVQKSQPEPAATPKQAEVAPEPAREQTTEEQPDNSARRISFTKCATGEFALYELTPEGLINVNVRRDMGAPLSADEMFRFGEEMQIVATELA